MKVSWPIKLLTAKFGEIERIWLVRDENDLAKVPDDGSAVYFIDDVPTLKKMMPDQLKEAHEAAKLFRGSRVNQLNDMAAERLSEVETKGEF